MVGVSWWCLELAMVGRAWVALVARYGFGMGWEGCTCDEEGWWVERGLGRGTKGKVEGGEGSDDAVGRGLVD